MDFSYSERFDQHKLFYILENGDKFKNALDNKPAQKTILKKYLRLSNNGVIETSYKFGSDGRLHAKGAISLQGMERSIRHTIANEFYNDIDIANCHPNLLKFVCQKNNILTPALDEYIADRTNILGTAATMNGKTPDDIKKLMLAIIYGGSRDYNELEHIPEFLMKFKNEMTAVFKNIAALRQKDFNKFKARYKKGGDATVAFVNNILLHQECGILQKMIEFYGIKTNDVCVLCHDGIMLDKSIDPRLNDLTVFINESVGISLNFIVKPMTTLLPIPATISEYIGSKNQKKMKIDKSDLELPNEDIDDRYWELDRDWRYEDYMLLQKQYQKKHYLPNWYVTDYVKSVFLYITRNGGANDMWFIKSKNSGKFEICDGDPVPARSKLNFKFNVAYDNGSVDDKMTLSKIMSDNMCNLQTYSDITYIPYLFEDDIDHLSKPNIYNTFKGFENAKCIEKGDVQPELDEDIAKVLNHELYMCGGNTSYAEVSWIQRCHLIQKPWEKTGKVMIYLSKQGTGKTMMNTEMWNYLLGTDYVRYYESLGEYVDGFSGEGDEYTIVKTFDDEDKAKRDMKNIGKFKSKTTSKDVYINKKYVKQFKIPDYSLYYVHANNSNPLPIENDSNRRFNQFKNPDAPRPKSYYNEFYDVYFKDPAFIQKLFKYMALQDLTNLNIDWAYVKAAYNAEKYIDVDKKTNSISVFDKITTDNEIEQKINYLTSVEKFFVYISVHDETRADHPVFNQDGDIRINRKNLYSEYSRWHSENIDNNRMSNKMKFNNYVKSELKLKLVKLRGFYYWIFNPEIIKTKMPEICQYLIDENNAIDIEDDDDEDEDNLDIMDEI